MKKFDKDLVLMNLKSAKYPLNRAVKLLKEAPIQVKVELNFNLLVNLDAIIKQVEKLEVD